MLQPLRDVQDENLKVNRAGDDYNSYCYYNKLIRRVDSYPQAFSSWCEHVKASCDFADGYRATYAQEEEQLVGSWSK